MAAPQPITPTDLTPIALALTSALAFRGIVADASSTTAAVVAEALEATVRHNGHALYDAAYRMPDGSLRRVAYDPGFYGFEGATEIEKPFRTLSLTVEDGDWQPRGSRR